MSDDSLFTLDARGFHVTFVASLGPWRVRGTFHELDGELVIPDADIERASIRLDIRAESIDTGLAMRDRHLRGGSFLDVARHPRISFESTRVTRADGHLLVAGRLTLRGIARDVVARCPLARVDGNGMSGLLAIRAAIELPLREHGVAVPRGRDRLNPIFLLIGDRVALGASLTIPADRLLPALFPALGH